MCVDGVVRNAPISGCVLLVGLLCLLYEGASCWCFVGVVGMLPPWVRVSGVSCLLWVSCLMWSFGVCVGDMFRCCWWCFRRWCCACCAWCGSVLLLVYWWALLCLLCVEVSCWCVVGVLGVMSCWACVSGVLCVLHVHVSCSVCIFGVCVGAVFRCCCWCVGGWCCACRVWSFACGSWVCSV